MTDYVKYNIIKLNWIPINKDISPIGETKGVKFMPSWSFEINNKRYDLNDVTENCKPSHEALEPLSSDAVLYTLVRKEEESYEFVATIVGDKCKWYDSFMGKEMKEYVFVSFETDADSSMDKIALQRALNFLKSNSHK